jgi:hypothetical protein
MTTIKKMDAEKVNAAFVRMVNNIMTNDRNETMMDMFRGIIKESKVAERGNVGCDKCILINKK